MDISYCDDKTGFPRPGHKCNLVVKWFSTGDEDHAQS